MGQKQEQIIYLTEAEKIFKAFDKVPNELWEEEYEKYRKVLSKYQDIRMLRWDISNKKKESEVQYSTFYIFINNKHKAKYV